MEVSTFNPGTPAERRMRVIRYLGGRSIQLADAVAAKTTWPKPLAKVSAPSRDRILHPAKDCVFSNSEIFLRHENLLGQKVAVVSMSFVDTVWRAPELGCEVIQRRSGYKHEGVFKTQSETRPVDLRLGDPDPRLFDERADYAEVRPSELLKRMMAKVGVAWDTNMQREAELLDSRFFGEQ
ncbi:MAG: hypothetical protein ACE145_10675 [Terriglobia bacterium]